MHEVQSVSLEAHVLRQLLVVNLLIHLRIIINLLRFAHFSHTTNLFLGQSHIVIFKNRIELCYGDFALLQYVTGEQGSVNVFPFVAELEH